MIKYHNSIYKPGIKYAILSRILFSISCEQPLVSGTCCVRHNNGPSAQSSESSKTDKLPETAIWPLKTKIDKINKEGNEGSNIGRLLILIHQDFTVTE